MRGDAARNRGDEVVTAEAITMFDMVLFEDHLTGCPNVGRMDSWCSTSGLGDLAGGTEKIVTLCTGNVVGAWKKGTITETDQVICGGRGHCASLLGDILDGGEAGMGQAVMQ